MKKWPGTLTLRSRDFCGKCRGDDGQCSDGGGSELHVDGCGGLNLVVVDMCWFWSLVVFELLLLSSCCVDDFLFNKGRYTYLYHSLSQEDCPSKTFPRHTSEDVMHSCLGSMFAKRLVVCKRVPAVGDIFSRRSFAGRSNFWHIDQSCQDRQSGLSWAE